MAREQVGVIESFFARADLPPEVRAVEREAVASAWAVGAVVALESLESPGVPRFLITDRLAHYFERPAQAMQTRSPRDRSQLEARVSELEALAAADADDRAAMLRHIEVLERHLALFGVRAKEMTPHE